MVTLLNRTNLRRDFNLEHANWCTDTECSCTPTKIHTIEETKKGRKGTRERVLQVPTSMTLLAKEKRSFPDRILECVEVAAALDKGDLVKLRQG